METNKQRIIMIEERTITWQPRLQRIQELKEELSRSDYIALKAFEGADMAEYPNWKEKRQGLRDEINRLEGMADEEWDEENERLIENT